MKSVVIGTEILAPALLIDRVPTGFHNAPMASNKPRETPTESDLRSLDFRVDELIRVVERLNEENRSLQQKQEALVSERAALLQKNELVRTRVEAMISRLRAMEQSS